MDWLWKGILTSVVAAILWFIGDRVFKKIWEKSKEEAALARYRLTVFTCLVIITAAGFHAFGFVPFRKPTPLPPPPPKEVNGENIEDYVREWTDHVNISIRRQTTPPDAFFLYTAQTQMGDPVDIFRSKDKPGYLQFKASLTFADEHLVIVQKMPKRDFVKFITGLSLELARMEGMSTGLGWNPDQQGHPQGIAAFMQVSAPIANMNEGSFVATFDREASALGQSRAFVNESLGTLPANIPKAMLPR